MEEGELKEDEELFKSVEGVSAVKANEGSDEDDEFKEELGQYLKEEPQILQTTVIKPSDFAEPAENVQTSIQASPVNNPNVVQTPEVKQENVVQIKQENSSEKEIPVKKKKSSITITRISKPISPPKIEVKEEEIKDEKKPLKMEETEAKQIKPLEIKAEEIKPQEIKPEEIKAEEIKLEEAKEIKSEEAKVDRDEEEESTPKKIKTNNDFHKFSPHQFPSALSNSLTQQVIALSEQIEDSKLLAANGLNGSSTAIGDQIQYSADGRPKLIVSIELDLIKILSLNQFAQTPSLITPAQFLDPVPPPPPPVPTPPPPSQPIEEPPTIEKQQKKSTKSSKTSLAPPPPPPPPPPPQQQQQQQPSQSLVSPKSAKVKEAEKTKRNETKTKPQPSPSQAQKRAGEETETVASKKPKISNEKTTPVLTEKAKNKPGNAASLHFANKSKSFSAAPSSSSSSTLDLTKKPAKFPTFTLDFLTS